MNVVEMIREERKFVPQKMPDAELRFIMDHLGDNPAVALQGGEPVPPEGDQSIHTSPDGERITLYRYTLSDGTTVVINRRVVHQVMDEFRDLHDAAEVGRATWCGYDAIRECIEFWLEKYRAEWDRLKQIDPKLQHPSRNAYDSRGNAIYQGVGSDSRYVKTWIDKNGDRREFAIALTERPPSFAGNWFVGLGVPAKDPKQIDEMVAEDPDALQSDMTSAERMGRHQIVQEAKPDQPMALIWDEDKNRCECPVCGHTQVYKPDNSASKRMARVRMAKHAASASDEREAHQQFKYEEFGG